MSEEKSMTATDAQILGYIGIVCIHSKSAPCAECAKVLPDQLRPDKRVEFDRIKQACATTRGLPRSTARYADGSSPTTVAPSTDLHKGDSRRHAKC
jgi:hypothetical protein